MSEFDYVSAIQSQIAQNNAWSAEQAQKQMDFQERMSNTAHQRELADLKAAGLNPVLSAKLGGASTPSGASAAADPGATSALVSLFNKVLDIQSDNAKANLAQASSGYVSDSSAKAVVPSVDTAADAVVEAGTAAAGILTDGVRGIKNAVNGFIHGITGQSKGRYDNEGAYAMGARTNGTYNAVSQSSKNVKIIDQKTGEYKKNSNGSYKTPGLFSNVITTIQRALTGSNRKFAKPSETKKQGATR